MILWCNLSKIISMHSASLLPLLMRTCSSLRKPDGRNLRCLRPITWNYTELLRENNRMSTLHWNANCACVANTKCVFTLKKIDCQGFRNPCQLTTAAWYRWFLCSTITTRDVWGDSKCMLKTVKAVAFLPHYFREEIMKDLSMILQQPLWGILIQKLI